MCRNNKNKCTLRKEYKMDSVMIFDLKQMFSFYRVIKNPCAPVRTGSAGSGK
jgi:hypothetical protein